LFVAADFSRPVQPLFEGPPREGRIHSRVRQAVYLVLDGTVLALLSASLPRMPNSIRLAPGQDATLLPMLKPGMGLVAHAGALHIPGCGAMLALPATQPWEPRPRLVFGPDSGPLLRQRAKLLVGYLAGAEVHDGLAPLAGALLLGLPDPETPLARASLPALRALIRSTLRRDLDGVAAAAKHLAGLGPGLTPSGDDTLAGFAAVLALFGAAPNTDDPAHVRIAATIAAVAAPCTTPLSGALLIHAARGEVAEPLGDLFHTFAQPDAPSQAIIDCAQRVLAHGATSGGDVLLGIGLAMHALERG
jgi:hypothetical protein